jgi:hypothetical protein
MPTEAMVYLTALIPTPVRTPKLRTSHQRKAPTRPAAPVPEEKYLFQSRHKLTLFYVTTNRVQCVTLCSIHTQHFVQRYVVDHMSLTVGGTSIHRDLWSSSDQYRRIDLLLQGTETRRLVPEANDATPMPNSLA